MNEFFATNAGIAVIMLGQSLLVVGFVMVSLLFLVYGDRKIWAAVQMRRGPNVVGPFGLLQSFADGLKVFLQETIIPSAANRGLFLIAPIITFTVSDIFWLPPATSAVAIGSLHSMIVQ